MVDLLFQYIIKSVKSVRICTDGKKSSLVPSLRMVVDWISMIIESHFTLLIRECNTDDELVKLILDIQILTSKHIAVCDSLYSINGYLSQFKKKEVSLKVEIIPEYCIEVLTL